MRSTSLLFLTAVICANFQSAVAFATPPCKDFERKTIVCEANGRGGIHSIEFPADKMMAIIHIGNGTSESLYQGTVTESLWPTFGYGFSAGRLGLLGTYCEDDHRGSFGWEELAGGRVVVSLQGSLDPLVFDCAELN